MTREIGDFAIRVKVVPYGGCDPLNLSSHKWEPFAKSLLKCARPGCGVVVTKMLFEIPKEQLF